MKALVLGLLLFALPLQAAPPKIEEVDPEYVLIRTAQLRELIHMINVLAAKVEELELQVKRLKATTGCS